MDSAADDYEVIRLLGSGASGAVYLARQRETGRLVALKYLRTGGLDPQALGRFRREAAVLAALDAPSVVALAAPFEAAGQLVLVMTYVDGLALSDVIGVMSPAVGLGVLDQLGAPLDIVHDSGIVHRDLKPANLLLDRQGACWIADFGIARFVGESMQVAGRNVIRTRTGLVIGTPAYIAPEIAAGAHDVDRRADIYSLAVIAYHWLVGRQPFDGDGYELLRHHVETPPPRPSEVCPGFPLEVEHVLLRGLAKDPAERFGRAGEFAHALRVAASSAWPTASRAELGAIIAFRSDELLAANADSEQVTMTDVAPMPLPQLVRLPTADLPIFRPPPDRSGRARRLAVVVVAAAILGAVLALVFGW